MRRRIKDKPIFKDEGFAFSFSAEPEAAPLPLAPEPPNPPSASDQKQKQKKKKKKKNQQDSNNGPPGPSVPLFSYFPGPPQFQKKKKRKKKKKKKGEVEVETDKDEFREEEVTHQLQSMALQPSAADLLPSQVQTQSPPLAVPGYQRPIGSNAKIQNGSKGKGIVFRTPTPSTFFADPQRDTTGDFKFSFDFGTPDHPDVVSISDQAGDNNNNDDDDIKSCSISSPVSGSNSNPPRPRLKATSAQICRAVGQGIVVRRTRRPPPGFENDALPLRAHGDLVTSGSAFDSTNSIFTENGFRFGF
mmetsp:Transcript_28708/g.56404  ORF Transcript_28708/g.56404 Transcript_28708/m.56404 type:complete len:302 (+) Transcript_28708:16-921(+)